MSSKVSIICRESIRLISAQSTDAPTFNGILLVEEINIFQVCTWKIGTIMYVLYLHEQSFFNGINWPVWPTSAHFAPILRILAPEGRRKIGAGAGRKNTQIWAHFGPSTFSCGKIWYKFNMFDNFWKIGFFYPFWNFQKWKMQ